MASRVKLDLEWASCTPADGDLLWYEAGGAYVRTRGDVGTILDQRSYYHWLVDALGAENTRTILDLGGNIGASALYFRRVMPGCRVVSVEPLPASADLLRRNCAGDDSVVLVQRAVVPDGQAGQPATLYVGRSYSTQSTLRVKEGWKTVTVETTSLRDLLHDWRPVAVKCDIEGAEMSLDWRQLRPEVRVVAMELHQYGRDAVERGRAVDEQLLSLGFRHLRAPQHRPLFRGLQIAVWTRGE